MGGSGSGAIPVDAEGRGPFRIAVERKDFDRLQAILAPDVQFRSPVVFRPYEGREAVAALLRVVGVVLTPALSYQWQVQQGDREVLCFTSEVGGRQIEGVDLLQYDDRGLVAELVVMMRPASALEAVRDGIARVLQAGSQAPR